MVFAAHIAACGWWWVGTFSLELHKVHPQHYDLNTTIIKHGKVKNYDNATLIEDIWWGQSLIDRDQDDFNRKYIISFYWSVVTLLTTGYKNHSYTISSFLYQICTYIAQK